MISELNYQKIQALAGSISEQEIAFYRHHFLLLASKMDNGSGTLLKHLKKIPRANSPGEYSYEYELSDFFKSFLIFMENEFKGKDQDLKSAIIFKIIGEQSSNSNEYGI